MRLEPDQLFQVIGLTPLVSIDLVLRNAAGEVLLGYRTNRPAKDSWFVPGGRIDKDERLQDALKRIAQRELGAEVAFERLIAAFDHLYEDNFRGTQGPGTHYVVVAIACSLPPDATIAPDAQHSALKWWRVEDLLIHPQVHPNTKLYFRADPANGFRA